MNKFTNNQYIIKHFQISLILPNERLLKYLVPKFERNRLKNRKFHVPSAIMNLYQADYVYLFGPRNIYRLREFKRKIVQNQTLKYFIEDKLIKHIIL